MRNDIVESMENARQVADAILAVYDIKSKFYIKEMNVYNALRDQIANSLITAYDNGYAAGIAKAGN